MSNGGDDFFSRWARRKRAARTADDAGAKSATDSDAKPPLPEDTPAPADPVEPMPSLDDLTPEGDLAAFLREGVPAALKNAAMRKMWSLDPAIRNHIGPAEYAWDFNKPGSMPGFGPLEPGGFVADFLSTASRALPTASETSATTSPTLPRQVTAGASEKAAGSPPAEALETAAEPPQPEDDEATAAEPAQSACPADSPRAAPKPRHGGALPH